MTTKEKTTSDRKTAIIVGILILLAYSLLGSDNPDAKVLGMFLEVISGLAVIGIAVLMYPLFKPYNKTELGPKSCTMNLGLNVNLRNLFSSPTFLSAA